MILNRMDPVGSVQWNAEPLTGMICRNGDPEGIAHLFQIAAVIYGGNAIRMYMLNKCLATLLVMIWNYFTKRAVLYRKAKHD